MDITQKQMDSDCYEIIPDSASYVIYRILAYDMSTRKPSVIEPVERGSFVSHLLAVRKRDALELALRQLNKYGFSWHEDVR